MSSRFRLVLVSVKRLQFCCCPIVTGSIFDTNLAHSNELCERVNISIFCPFIHGEYAHVAISLRRPSLRLILCETPRTCWTTFQNCNTKTMAKMQETTNTLVTRPAHKSYGVCACVCVLRVCACALVFAHRTKKMIGKFQFFLFVCFSLWFCFCWCFAEQKPILFLIFHIRGFCSLFGICFAIKPFVVRNESHV